MTFPFVIDNDHTHIQVYNSLEKKTISLFVLWVPEKLEIPKNNSIIKFLEIGGYRKYSQHYVDFGQKKVHDLIWASHKDLSKKFFMKYKL
jgi:hypothetical protein